MNKQIEEMAKDICHLPCTCDECTYPKYRKNIDKCKAKVYAERAYKKGYRKQIEGENISQMHPSDEFICEKCGLIIRDCCRYVIDEDDGDEICYEFPYKFCPRCGMKVKGDKTDA